MSNKQNQLYETINSFRNVLGEFRKGEDSEKKLYYDINNYVKDYKILQDEITECELKDKIKNHELREKQLLDEIISIEKKLQQTINEQKDEIMKLKSNCQMNEQELLEKDQISIQKVQEIQKVNEQLIQYQQYKEDINLNLIQLKQDLIQLENEKKNLSSQLQDINQVQLDKDNLIQKLNQQLLEQKQQIDTLNNINNNNKNNSYDDYDIIIDFPNVDSFIIENASWTIFVCNSLYESYTSLLEENDNDINKIDYPLNELLEGSHKFKTACVVGNFNRGKTFVINLINQCNLPSGRRTKTKGLSIIISQNNSTLFIDTQGCNTPLPNNNTENNETLKEIYNIKQNDSTDQELNNLHLARKKATELFHQEVAISLSNVVMHVVNEMTWNDQQNIMALQRKIMNQDDSKDNKDSKDAMKTRYLYVIHNYMNVSNKEDLMAMVKTYVTTPFRGQFQSHYDKECTVFYYNDAKNRTTHFFLCNNNSEFGRKWNSVISSIIRSNIKSIPNENPEFDTLLLNTVHNSMKVNIKNPRSLKIIPYSNQHESSPEITKEKIQNNFIFNRKKKDINSEYIKSLEEYESLFINTGSNEVDVTQKPLFSIVPNEAVQDPKYFALKDKDVDFVDNQVVFSGGFKPSYDRLEIGNKLIFTFDMPYLCKEEIKHCIAYDKYEDKNYLRVMGNRKLKYKTQESNVTCGGEFNVSDYPSEGVKQTPNPRKHGEFDIKIPIPACYPLQYFEDFENGMLTITFEKPNENDMTPDKSN